MSETIPKSILQIFQLNRVNCITLGAACMLFACSSLRHALFQSGALDLGIFDQAIYLISVGKVPISSFMGFHILADHVALIFYPLAILYKIYPDVHWLFAVQAIALSLGVVPVWHLAKDAGLKESQALAMIWVYLLYPLVFNVNLFDFHADTIALPAFLWAILMARRDKIAWFCVAIGLILSCKAVFSLTVIALGFWLLLFEKKQLCGVIAMGAGVAWFLIATRVIIPFFGGEVASIGRHLHRYGNLGSSFPEIAKNVFLNPVIILKSLFSLPNLEYLCLLLLPVIWGLSPQHLTALVGAVPTLAMNLLADSSTQKNLIYQYSVPILPFLMVAVIASLGSGKSWLQSRQRIVLFSLIGFIALGKYGNFFSGYLSSLDTWQATREAISRIDNQGSVLSTSKIAPHLAHRPIIKIATPAELATYETFDNIILNMRHPGGGGNAREGAKLIFQQLQNNGNFNLIFQKNDVWVFVKKSIPPTFNSK